MMLFIGIENPILNLFTEGSEDGMGDVGMELGPTLLDVIGKGTGDRISTLIAVLASDGVLEMAAGTANRQLAARHCDEETLVPLDETDVPDDEAVVKGHATKCT